MTSRNRKRRGLMSSPPQSLLTLIALVAVACTETAPVPDGVSGTYIGVGAIRPAAPDATSLDTGDAPDTVTYTLRIRESDGFASGVWTITGDTAQPTDPWDAVITGDYTDGRMVLEYHSPTLGQCHLAGTIVDALYMAEHRCEPDWSTADTLELVWIPSVCPPGSEVWRGLSVCDEGEREGYDRDALGTGYRSLEDEIIASRAAEERGQHPGLHALHM